MSGPVEATTDLGRAMSDLDRFGFCIVEDVLDEPTVAEVCDRILEQAETERRRSLDHGYPAEAVGDDVNQWVYQLINKGEILHQLPVHPVARTLATHVLGRTHLLSSMDAHITYPGNLEMPLHADQWWMPPPMIPGGDYVRQGDIERTNVPIGPPEPADHPITGPLILNAMWMLTDFTSDNGATRLVPGSHLSGCSPGPGADRGAMQAVGRSGSVVAWDGRTWHAAGLNTSDGPRVGITTYFCGPMVRQLSNGTYGTRTEVRDALASDLLELLGFTPFSSYGMTDDPSTAFAEPGDRTEGILRRDGG